MQYKILKDDERLGIKAGEIYEGERYKYDPQTKVSLLYRIPDGYKPECNMYLDDVAHKFKGRWKVIKNNTFIDE